MSLDTGFPEPLNRNRNTTKRHPDAKVGDDAVIGGDVYLAYAPKRRFSRHQHTISWGKLDPSDDSDKAPASSMHPGRPGRAMSLLNMHQDPSKLPSLSMARRPSPPRRGIKFSIDEAVDEQGISDPARDALRIANGSVCLDEDPLVVDARRQHGHHRVGSVDSDISTPSTNYADCPSESGDEALDSAKEPSRLRRRKSLFALVWRSTNKAGGRSLDDD